MSKKTASRPLTGQHPLGLTPHLSWQLVYEICFTRRGVLGSNLVVQLLSRHTNPLKIRTALHYAACAVQVALHSLRQCQWHSVTCTAVRLTATKLKSLLVRLSVHLDCDQCGRPLLAARVLQFRWATVCLRYNNRPNESVNWPAREADNSLPQSTAIPPRPYTSLWLQSGNLSPICAAV
jgi:hypothetical protein